MAGALAMACQSGMTELGSVAVHQQPELIVRAGRFVVRHATSIARIGEGAIRGMASHREPCATTGMLTRAFLPHSALICGSGTRRLIVVVRAHRAVSASYCHAAAFRSASSIAHTPADRLKPVDMGEIDDG